MALTELPDGQYAAYVPLQPVADDNAGTVAFSGKMLYRPLVDAWGSAHRVSLVWVVQALVDNVPTGEGEATADNQLQVLHTYEDAWTLTGLNVREDHGAGFALIHEDPGADADLKDDSALLTLGYQLGQTFLAGRADAEDALDLSLTEIERRFDVTSTATLTERWGITQTLAVSTYAFDHFDEAVMTMAMTETATLLSRFDPYWAAATPISPTLLLAGQQLYRAANLDLAGSAGNSAVTGPYMVDASLCGPLPPPPVSGEGSPTEIMLSWPDTAVSYQVWWSVDDPYFTPGANCAAAGNCAEDVDGSYTHALPGDGSLATFVVRAGDSCSGSQRVSADSNRVSTLTFQLSPGGQ